MRREGAGAAFVLGGLVAIVSCGGSGSTTAHGPSGSAGGGASGSGSAGTGSATGGSGSGIVAESGQSSGAGTTSGDVVSTSGSGASGASGDTGNGDAPDTGVAGTSGEVPTVDSGGSAGSGMGTADSSTVAPPDTGTASGSSGSSSFTGPSYPYILSCFDDDNTHASDLMIYTSNDALNWTLFSDTGYVGPTGYMRDPSIMRHTDGKYYVAYTTPPDLGCCSAEQSFAIGSSTNLKDWTTIAQVPCGVAGTKNTWSPEWFVDTDGSVHITATLDLKIYRYEPTDATLTKWSAPTPINISGSIDAQIIKIGSTYHVIIPNKHGTASSLDGPWTYDNLVPPKSKEGPAIVHISGNTWRYYVDDGGNGHEESSLTTDELATWSPFATLPVVGNNISQGTVRRGDTGHPF